MIAQGPAQHSGATVIQLSELFPLPFVVQIQSQAQAPPQRGWLRWIREVFASYLLRLLSRRISLSGFAVAQGASGVGASVTQLCSIAGRRRRSWCVCSSSPPADRFLGQRFTPSNPAAGAQHPSFPPTRARLFFPPCRPPALFSSLSVRPSFGMPPSLGSSWQACVCERSPRITQDPASPLLRAMGQFIRRLTKHLREVIAYFEH